MHRRCCWPPDRDVPGRQLVLDLVPQRRAAERALDDLVELGPAPPAGEPKAGGDVVVDRHRRERVGSLEDHPDDAPERDRIDGRVVDVLAIEPDRALEAGGRRQLMHPVEGAQERALAAAGRSDDGRDRVWLDGQADVADGPERAVVDVESLDLDASRGRRLARQVARRRCEGWRPDPHRGRIGDHLVGFGRRCGQFGGHRIRVPHCARRPALRARTRTLTTRTNRRSRNAAPHACWFWSSTGWRALM